MAGGIAHSYEGKSQADIHKAVCALTLKIRGLRDAKGYTEQAKLQKARRDRAALQALLTKPTLVWVNPCEPAST